MKPTNLTCVVTAAAMLIGSGLLPTASTARADMVFKPGLTGQVQPKTPNFCAGNPLTCNPGIKMAPVGPAPMPAPPAPAPSAGIDPGAAAAIGIVGGIIVGTAIANAARQQQASNAAQAHNDWCASHYKSYEPYDNSWQPYEGPRRPCISPFN